MDIGLIRKQQADQIASGPPVAISIADVSIPATRGVAFFRLRYSEWGRDNQYETTIIARRIDMPGQEKPAPMTLCKVGGLERRILQIDEDATGECLYLSIGGKRHRG